LYCAGSKAAAAASTLIDALVLGVDDAVGVLDEQPVIATKPAVAKMAIPAILNLLTISP
jgi:hypothetical protein